MIDLNILSHYLGQQLNTMEMTWYHLPPLFWGDLIFENPDFRGGTCDFEKKWGDLCILGGPNDWLPNFGGTYLSILKKLFIGYFAISFCVDLSSAERERSLSVSGWGIVPYLCSLI